MRVELERLRDEAGLRRLLEVAVAQTDPDEAMPPMPGHPAWTAQRREAFLAFFGPMLDSPDVVIYAVIVEKAMAGFTRLKKTGQPGTAETGMWLGRTYRGRGIGAAVLQKLLREAAGEGLTRIVADTTIGNLAAQGVLRHASARMVEKDGKIYAEIAIDPAYASDLDK
jgi:RimJ/RimL family protein N-acetyltransferase